MTAREILAIDPGNVESAYTLLDADTCRPTMIGKVPNADLLDVMAEHSYNHLAVEMIASYGMPVGATVFDTCVWIGRFLQHHDEYRRPLAPSELIYRKAVKLHHCRSSKAKDANVAQALVDRFGGGASNRGKGTKAAPGWFYGFRADIWQAYAVGVLAADRIAGRA